ncbi:hypothetical protein C0993_009354, partial [Termitomyces sp. T159_Od127]
IAGPSEATNQELLTRASQHMKVKTYRLVKADKPDMRQVRDSEGSIWFMQEQCRSDHTRPGRHYHRANDKVTALQGSRKRTGDRHTISNKTKTRKYSSSIRCSSPVHMKKGQGVKHPPLFEDTEFEARSCTTPRNAEWAQWAIHATSKTRQSGQLPSSKAKHPGYKNADLKRTKSHAVPNQGESRRDVTAKGSGAIPRRDLHTLPDPNLHSEDATGDTNLKRESITSWAANRSRRSEDVGRRPQDETRSNSTALSTTPCSQIREVLIEDGSGGDSRESPTPRVANCCLPPVKPLNQRHQPGTSNDLKEYAEDTSQTPLQVERPLGRSNATRRSSHQGSSESPSRRETATPTENGRILENKSPILDINDLKTIPSENESDGLSRLPAVSRMFDWPMDFEEQRSSHRVHAAVSDHVFTCADRLRNSQSWCEHNCNKPLPDLPKEDGSPKILLRRKPESLKTISNRTQVGSRFFETGLV